MKRIKMPAGRDELNRQIYYRCIFWGVSLGIVTGLLYQAVFLSLSIASLPLGVGFGGITGLIMGLVDGHVAVRVLARFPAVTDERKYRITLEGNLLLATIAVIFSIYVPVFALIGGSGSPVDGFRVIAGGFLVASPIAFLAAICSLIASRILGNSYLEYLEYLKYADEIERLNQR